ncbi:MAG: sugar ABC transporter ATP-binding protein [Phycisphaerales bacterium]|nr:sugar ABC transporter ATP-binding protein [Phycisphaerales bacterium]
MSGAAARLSMSGIRKRFGATTALDGVSLSVAPGEVHALLGENGAGKSTLMKVLAGAIRPDEGSIALDGAAFEPRDPLSARRAGIAMIYQELNLAPHLTVEQNLTLGIEARRAGWIRSAAHRDRVIRALAQLDRPDIRPAAVVGNLPPAARQLVEIARALMTEARVIVMDEPTSSLSLADIEHLFNIIHNLRAAGVSVVYISHFLEETQRIANRYTVLRDGRSVQAGSMSGASIASLVEAMIGRRLDELFPRVPRRRGEIALHVDEVAGQRLPKRASLALHRGEVLGIAGLVGAGRTELLRAVFGLDAVREGKIRITAISGGGNSFAAEFRPSPVRSLVRGMGLLSEDRAREGLAASRTIADNMLLSKLAPLGRWGLVSPAAARRESQKWIERLTIRCRGGDQTVRDLSGGNQQKVAIARLLHHDVDVLLLDEPTRGIDVGSKAQIYRLIGELAARGKAVLVVSSYMPELLGLCDRIAVMHRGMIVETRAAETWTEHELIAIAASGKGAAGA